MTAHPQEPAVSAPSARPTGGGWRTSSTASRRASGASLSDDEVIAIPVLYRATLSSLSMARAISLDKSLVDYLESLSHAGLFLRLRRAHAPDRARGALLRARLAARRCAALWRETLVSGALSLLGTVVAYLLVRRNRRTGSTAFMSGRTARKDAIPAPRTRQLLRHAARPAACRRARACSRAFLFTHNAQIALLAFALGFACCLPTAFLMIYNGLMLGAFFAVFAQHGLGVELGGWLFIHGMTELFAVTLAGAAGFHIGWALAFPGDARPHATRSTDAGRRGGGRDGRRRRDAGGRRPARRLRAPAHRTARWCATPSRAAMLALWCIYFYLPPGER